jgi:hypothetical protein
MKLLEFVKLFTNGPKAQGEFRFRVSSSGFRVSSGGGEAKKAEGGVMAKGKERRPPIGL